MKTARLYIRASVVRGTCAVCAKPRRHTVDGKFYTIGYYVRTKYCGIFVASQAACVACTRDRVLVLSPNYSGGEVWQ